MSWHKLKEMNDWGSVYVLIGRPHLSKFGTWSFHNEDGPKGTPFLKAGEYLVQFPNGEEAKLRVIMKAHSEEVGDMGHNYTVSSQVPYFVVDVHGQWTRVRATELDVKVWRDR